MASPIDTPARLLNNITDLNRLKRMARQTPKGASWQEILDTL